MAAGGYDTVLGDGEEGGVGKKHLRALVQGKQGTFACSELLPPDWPPRGRCLWGWGTARDRARQVTSVPVICVVVPAMGDGWVCVGRAVKACDSSENHRVAAGCTGKTAKEESSQAILPAFHHPQSGTVTAVPGQGASSGCTHSGIYIDCGGKALSHWDPASE